MTHRSSCRLAALAPLVPLAAGALVACASAATASPAPSDAAPSPDTVAEAQSAGGLAQVKTVFLILMENHNWSQIESSASAPYLNGTLLPAASYATNYRNPPKLHPSEPNYVWLEAGDNLGVTTDDDPATNHRATTDHLVTYLQNAGISWRSYQEDIDGTTCPVHSSGLYAAKHDPMVFFDDVTDGNQTTSANCIAHVRPYGELATDLANGTVAKYNFITPNLCNDMHGASGCPSDQVKTGDQWLAGAIPPILASSVYQTGGAVFVTWDESEGGEFPIGMIVVSPFAKGGGYAGSIAYTHSSTLRTMQEIFGVSPWLGDAANAADLGDLFTP